MKQKNAIRLLILIVGLTVVIASISVSVAYMLTRSDILTNIFVPAEVSCKVVESGTETSKTSVKVENTGDTDVYVRVRVVTYWEDSKGNPVARTSPENKFGTGQNDWKYDATKWIYDEKNQTFYYKASVKEGQTTAELLTSAIPLEVIEEAGEGNVKFTYHQVVEFIAEVIQSSPDDAVKEAWGVTLDGNDQITGFSKTTTN